ncbi:MAG: hypothetical protein FWC97_09105 [Treponema sp.]|nr:hypothetical protein [Treponema sp.]
MKKSIFTAIAILAVTSLLFVTGCDQNGDDTPEPRDNSWLVGTWHNDNDRGGTTFTINADLTFVCDIIGFPIGIAVVNIRALGMLGYSGGLGNFEFYLANMTTADDGIPDGTFTQGNEAGRGIISEYNDLPVTLTPNAARTEFVFFTIDGMANGIFGGTFTRQEANDEE